MEGDYLSKKIFIPHRPLPAHFFLSDLDSLSKNFTYPSKAHFQIAGAIDSRPNLLSPMALKPLCHSLCRSSCSDRDACLTTNATIKTE